VLFQGDIFRSALTVVVGHPDVAAALFDDETPPDEASRTPGEDEIRRTSSDRRWLLDGAAASV
jgi:hypothetical protein